MKNNNLGEEIDIVRNFYASCSVDEDTASKWLKKGEAIANKLVDLNIDQDTICAALLLPGFFDTETSVSTWAIRRQFGREVLKLVYQTGRLSVLQVLGSSEQEAFSPSDTQVRKAIQLVLNLVEDFRSILLRMAERVWALESGEFEPETPEHYLLCAELEQVYAPVSERMGLGVLHSQIGDVLFASKHPDSSVELRKIIEQHIARHKPLEALVKKHMEESLALENIAYQIDARVKSPHSIWDKMQRKQVSASEVYDILALRILVDRKEECFRVLGIIHSLWRPIHGEFDDYISHPKTNGYQSLHTSVLIDSQRVAEFQVRTRAMHAEAELGVCAHWNYKQSEMLSDPEDDTGQRLEWLHHLVRNYERTGVVGKLNTLLNRSTHSIYVYTQDGEMVELPAGSTALDMAYHVNEADGHRARGAEINGRAVPLTTKLQIDQVVSIENGADAEPLLAWRDSQLDYVSSSLAQGAIAQWFADKDRKWQRRVGVRELKLMFEQLGLDESLPEALVQKLNYENLGQLGQRLINGNIEMSTILGALEELPPMQEGYSGNFTIIALDSGDLASIFECLGGRATRNINMDTDDKNALRVISVDFAGLPLSEFYYMCEYLRALPYVQTVKFKKGKQQ